MSRLTIDITDNNQAWQELKALLNTRINEGIEGKVSAKSIDDILNEELAGNEGD
ncbi:hypothetical protein ACP179_23595 [Xenorhabdus stockiae]|uniref:hypothetical protein n=1 Tax=Xenorhabdus stockiae TaxID=351614 RepID=UPI003CF5E1A9